MGKEDHLTKQINQLGAFLQRLKEKLLGGGSNAKEMETNFDVEKALSEELGVVFEFIEKASEEALLSFLDGNIAYTPKNIELLADVLVSANAEKYASRALSLYQYVNAKTKEFSFERESKIKEIQRYL
jgi:hypothetical protein